MHPYVNLDLAHKSWAMIYACNSSTAFDISVLELQEL